MASGEVGDATRGTRAAARMRRDSKATWQGRGWPTWGAGGARRGHVAKGPRDNANKRGRPCGAPRVAGYREG